MSKSNCIIETPLTKYLKSEVNNLVQWSIKLKNPTEPTKDILISKIEMVQAVINLTKQTDKILVKFSTLKSLDDVRSFKS